MVCVLTGAGSGLGRALAVELTGRGVMVAGFGRRLDALEETARLAAPGRFATFALDVADAAAVDRAFADVAEKLGPVEILINNAAVYPHRDFLETPAPEFMQTVAVNLGGMVACSAAALRGMVQTGRGRILNVATFADLAPLAASSAYSVSKGAARIFTRALVADLADRFPGIVINDWIPGALSTEMGIPEGLDPAIAARWGADLALWQDPSLTGTTWDRDQEMLPPRSLKRRLLERLGLRPRPLARRLA